MVRTTTDKRINKINMITVPAVFLLVLLLSLITPLITDDLHFNYVWNGFDADIGNEVRIASIGVVKSDKISQLTGKMLNLPEAA